MRVNAFHPRRDERGAVLVIVAAFTIVAVVFLAFVIDIGNQRQNRRQLTTGTDSASLDAAQEWTATNLSTAGFSTVSDNVFDCSSIAGSTVAADAVRANNDGVDTDNVECRASLGSYFGVITVGSDEAVDYEFGKAVGVSSGLTGSVTSVRISSTSHGGLRPFALCVNYPGVKEWIAEWTDGDDDDPSPVTIDVLALKFLHPECVQAAGNWGAGDFSDEPEFTGGGANALGQALGEGSYKPWQTSSSEDTCAETTPASCMDALAGAKWNSNNISKALNFLEGGDGTCATGGMTFYIPTYGEAVSTGGGGGGTQTGYPVTGFAEVQLMCYDVQGSDLNEFVLKFISYDPDGPCCSYSTGHYELEICDVGTIGGDSSTDWSQKCAFAAWSPPELEEDVDAEPDVCKAVLTVNNKPSTYNNVQSEANKPLDISAAVSGDDCGTLGFVLRRHSDSTEFAVGGPYEAPTMSAVVLKTDTVWGDGTFTIEVRSDGDVLDSESFSLS